MIISTTGTLSPDQDFLVYHGPYKEIIPQMAADGYQAVEMHIFDSSEIDRKELWGLLRANGVRLTSIGTGDRKSTRLNSSHSAKYRMPSSA